MSLIVTKFGGTSLATPERVLGVAQRLVDYHQAGHQVVAVVSAMGKSTDDLLRLANSVNPNPPARELDQLMATGEMVSMSIVAMAVEALGVQAVSMTGRQAGIVTTEVFNKAKIAEIQADRILSELASGHIVIVAGFQGITRTGDITTLGRGGSDTTAVALAAGVGADVCEIYTDVDGVYTCDPRMVPAARKLDAISYEEMLELAAAGAGVLQMRSVEFARNYGVVIHCRSAFNDNPGTLVKEASAMEQAIVSGIAFDKSESKVTIRDVPDRVGIAAEVFGAIAAANINIDMIVQNISEGGSTDISFTVPAGELARLRPVLDSAIANLGIREYLVDESIAKISVVGAGMRSNPGVAARMFKTLADNNVNIGMISTSAIRISVVIDGAQIETALAALHTAFGLDSDNLFEETQLSGEELAAKAAKGR
ncbi:MAG: aspartate kinase [Coriobacteriales bacterium]|jgi:aspartate kinase|nr:aspartate kinase [Coriobacteriales bacterium]